MDHLSIVWHLIICYPTLGSLTLHHLLLDTLRVGLESALIIGNKGSPLVYLTQHIDSLSHILTCQQGHVDAMCQPLVHCMQIMCVRTARMYRPCSSTDRAVMD